MPPKVKTDRNAIVNAAFEVAVREGLASITAQNVSAVLDTSVAPIFREFQTIEELRTATAEKIYIFHLEYMKSYPEADSEFLKYGIAYIHFAKEYPHLFEMLMQPSRSTVSERLSGPMAFFVNSAGHDSGLSMEQARDLFFNTWIYTHGIACLVYKGNLGLAENEEKKLLIDAFQAFSQHLKASPASRAADLN